jgi:hypothetical protein
MAGLTESTGRHLANLIYRGATQQLAPRRLTAAHMADRQCTVLLSAVRPPSSAADQCCRALDCHYLIHCPRHTAATATGAAARRVCCACCTAWPVALQDACAEVSLHTLMRLHAAARHSRNVRVVFAPEVDWNRALARSAELGFSATTTPTLLALAGGTRSASIGRRFFQAGGGGGGGGAETGDYRRASEMPAVALCTSCCRH